MKKIVWFIVVLSMISSSIKAQSLDYKHFVRSCEGGCRAGEGDKNVYVPPPSSYYEMKRKRTNPQCTIKVKYSGFSDQAKAAFQYAIDIWQSTLKSPIAINIEAYWTSLEIGVLGSCAPYSYCQNFENAPKANCLYPVALAEKLSRKNQNHVDNPDLVIRFNSSRTDWYYGTDGNTPSKKYDLVSIVLHEIAHGLGFTGGGGVTGNYRGYWDASNPYIFDTYMVNGSGISIYNTSLYANPSSALYNQFCSGSVYFRSPLVLANNHNAEAKLYSPNPFSSGSSLYHLDETYYPAGDPNSLMSPNMGTAEAIHDPGTIVKSMFAEMDWFYTYIIHTPLKDAETFTEPFTVQAQISSDVSYSPESVLLHYSLDKFKTENILTMNTTSTAEIYTSNIPATQKACVVSYYLELTDTYKKRYSPTRNNNECYTFNVGVDKTPPIITHTALEATSTTNTALAISSQVSDNMGVGTVSLIYKVNNNPTTSLLLNNDSSTYYNGIINFSQYHLNDHDTIYYQIVAQDISSQQNQTTMPSPSTYYKVVVLATREYYVNNFTESTSDFTGSDFTVIKTSGFNKPVFYCKYINAGETTTKEYITQLKYPIRLRSDSALMQFDEVVLVEPSEVGAKFGDPDYFYDYVVVEGSKDYGKTWIRFIDGYNSRMCSDWLNAYFSGLTTDENSHTEGTNALLKRRTVNLYTQNGDFKGGDEIMIRFRLYSDPYNYGWGWAIDSLKIQHNIYKYINDKVTTVFQNATVSIYPNPAQEAFTIDASFASQVETLQVSIQNILGNTVYTTQLEGSNNTFYHKIATNQLKQGIYFVILGANGNQSVHKLIIK